MTLEEKAEKYVFSNPPSVVIDNHSYFLPSDLKQAYLAGAKENEKQLEQAKEIIKKFSEFANNEVEYDHEHPQEHTDLWNELCKKAEQFLKEVK